MLPPYGNLRVLKPQRIPKKYAKKIIGHAKYVRPFQENTRPSLYVSAGWQKRRYTRTEEK